MKFSDLLDAIACDAGDSSGNFRSRARMYLNLTRSFIADSGRWRSALRTTPTFTTVSGTSEYALTGYDEVVGNVMFDETNNQTIAHESLQGMQAGDPDTSTTSSPYCWADAGADSNVIPVVRLWPTPDGAYTIRFTAYARLTDVTENDEGLDTDPFFGYISPWGATFQAGMRYYYDLSANESHSQVQTQFTVFQRMLKMRRASNGLNSLASLSQDVVRTRVRGAWTGRLDPAHYNNG